MSTSFQFIIFDLDNTLYPPTSGVMAEIGRRIQVWMCDELDLSWEEATELRRQYLRRYGTTMGGLMAKHDVDVGQYLDFVHDIPIEDYLEPNPALAEMLAGIQLRKVVYTNATSEHGRRVLRALGVDEQFERVIGIHEVGLRNKLSPEAYERMLALLGAEGEACIMVEDSPRNLRPAKALGMTTILIDAEEGKGLIDVPERCIDVAVDSVLEVGTVVDRLLGDVEE
ncbi:MAG: pyrimidine 5'-nucleotidase [Chloroflexota bacterium]